MRVLTGFLLLASLPLQARELGESEQLAWFNYHLAVAEAPGDVRSDQLMIKMLGLTESLPLPPGGEDAKPSEPMRAYRARAQVVAAELEARVAAARDGDPFLLGGDLGCWPKAADMSTCDSRRAKLEPFAASNAYHGVVLMAYAWAREDADAFLRVARLAAAADTYDSLPAFALQSLMDRYQKVPLPATPDMDALTRSHTAEVMALAMSAAIAIPPLQHFSQPCRESEGELRAHCLAIARKMMSGQNLIEAGIGLSVVRALGSAEDIALADARQRETQWLQEKAVPLMAASEKFAVAGIDEFFESYGRDGEIEAMRALLKAHGIASLPPADWTKASNRPAANP